MGQTCSYILVQPGDSCGSLASRCNITPAQFTQYNPSSNLCSTLMPQQPVCCSAGALPDLSPKQNADGTCFSYTVQPGEYCQLIASNNYITVANIEAYNSQTWGWSGCNGLQRGANICLSPGDPPMPAVVDNAKCGPQVSGTARPANWSDISSLNPCPLNACCNIWGQCGITPEFCTATSSSTGAPGTAAPGTNGCISNCGTGIVRAPSPPANFFRVGYFEGFNSERPCLTMSADQIPAGYSHIHFSFAGMDKNFNVSLSGAATDQFQLFAKQTGFKRILAFGGWSFSTSADSTPIFRSEYNHAQRLAFARRVVAFVEQYALDGVDFDWEYPGAPDQPGAGPQDGSNYLTFLRIMRSLLPAGKTISVAAPASYYYLQGFPIVAMADVVDYIVYMTYDLHGQWDYGKPTSQDGCPTGGDCLRSHVNLTETNYALALITKAGVPSSKVVVGVASYARSFQMADPSCTGPTCRFTGPASGAAPGPCTNSPGYIAQAELTAALQGPGATTWHDGPSDSDIVTYGGGSWAAYMTDKTKASRARRYQAWNFAGSVDWAVDLAAFVPGTQP